MKTICREVVKHGHFMVTTFAGHYQMMVVLINPSVAKALARTGYTKQNLKTFVFENSKDNIENLSSILKYGDGVGRGHTIRSCIEDGWGTPKEWADLEPNVMVPVMIYPEVIHILVCGTRDRNKVMAFYGNYNRPSIKEIKLPKNWDELMERLGYPPLQNFYK